ncbi:MAG: flagellar assembly protein FliX [Alphaproteobacteria bacterium]|nr:flagellar assembly protein FliX [Alphaproteobacteria bacterium]
MALEIKTNVGNPVGTTLSKKIHKKTPSGATSFSALSEGETGAESVSFLQSGQSLSSVTVDHLLMLSGSSYNPEQKTLDYGHEVLSSLEAFRGQIICGIISRKTLEDIRLLLNEAPIEAIDPKLRSIVEDIRIRAEVELAKLEIQ